jgi:hypothetical protein
MKRLFSGVGAALVTLIFWIPASSSSAATVYCFAMERASAGQKDATVVIRKGTKVSPQDGVVNVASVGSLTYKVSVTPWNELELYVVNRDGLTTSSVGAASSVVNASVFQQNVPLINFECSANYDAATAYHVIRCDNVTPICRND